MRLLGRDNLLDQLVWGEKVSQACRHTSTSSGLKQKQQISRLNRSYEKLLCLIRHALNCQRGAGMIFLQWRGEGKKMIVILQKEIRTSEPVKQGEAIKPVPDECSQYLGDRKFQFFVFSLQSFGFVGFLRIMIATSVICWFYLKELYQTNLVSGIFCQLVAILNLHC